MTAEKNDEKQGIARRNKHRTGSERHITAHTVEAQVFRLVDSSGKERGLFQTDGDKAIFTLLSPLDNGPRIQIVTGLDGKYGYAELIFDDRSKAPLTGVHTDDVILEEYRPIVIGTHPFHDSACGYDPNPFVEINGRTSKSQARLSMSLLDQPSLEMNGRDGEQRIQICVWSGYGDPRIMLDSPHNESSLYIEPNNLHMFGAEDEEWTRYAVFQEKTKAQRKKDTKEYEQRKLKYSPQYRAVVKRLPDEIKALQAKGLLPPSKAKRKKGGK